VGEGTGPLERCGKSLSHSAASPKLKQRDRACSSLTRTIVPCRGTPPEHFR
jgi:hypothetical protein